MTKLRIGIAGASGFIGQAAIKKLSADYNIKAICRKLPKQKDNHENVLWY